VRAPGHGLTRLRAAVRSGRTTTLRVQLPTNLASVASGATINGDGVNLGALIDDTEGTNWAFLNGDIAGRQVTVRLPGTAPQEIGRVQISALLRPRNQNDPGGDTETQNRFSALRQFQLLTCTVGASVDCSQDSQFKVVYTSARDAFPGSAPRPIAPVLNLRSFDIPNVKASFVRLRVLTNQCTGGPDFQGDQDNDPANVTDCVQGSIQDTRVRVSELQVFRR
jgi:extracellular elastinolytic metalloproteinase